jgi:Peptidase M10 serralysin C terminal
MNTYLNGIIAQSVHQQVWLAGSAGTYGLIPAKGSTLTISFVDQDVVGREASKIRGYAERLQLPGDYFGWTDTSGAAIDIDYQSVSPSIPLVNQGFSNATSELSRVSGLRFAINTQPNVNSDINYFVNDVSSGNGGMFSSSRQLPQAQTVTSSEFEVPPQSPFALIGFNQNVIFDAFGLDRQRALNGLVLHELLHTFGFADVGFQSLLTQNDTALSYRYGASGEVRTSLSIADVYALQKIVGINSAQNGSDTVYSYSSSAPSGGIGYSTIWDAGGNDTLSAAGYVPSLLGQIIAQGATIDLRQGHQSSLDVDGYNLGIAYGAVIESAIGSSYDDIIVGNATVNDIKAGDGADYLFSGADALRKFKASPGSYLGLTRFLDPEYYTIVGTPALGGAGFFPTPGLDASDEETVAIDGVAGVVAATRDNPDILDGGAGNGITVTGAITPKLSGRNGWKQKHSRRLASEWSK